MSAARSLLSLLLRLALSAGTASAVRTDIDRTETSVGFASGHTVLFESVSAEADVIAQVWFILGMVLIVVIARGLGRRFGIPVTILLTLIGLVYGFLPGPKLPLEPEPVLLLVLPPLLYSTARRSSLMAVRANLRPIISLSVLLVLVTAFSVGIVLSVVVPAMPFAVAMILGAAVAPPDPVAALSIGRRAGMPPRLTTLIEGEGLLNDATALTTYQLAVTAAVTGAFSWTTATGLFALTAIGGLAVGTVAAVLIQRARPWLKDPLTANAVSLAAPFVIYLVAERIHASGVLAVVVAGLIIGHNAGQEETGAARLQTGAVWQLVEFLLEGFIFLLIGQQLPGVLSDLRSERAGVVVTAALVTVGVVLAVRPLWLAVTQLVPSRLHARLGIRSNQRLSGREVVALTWSGTRGVITLAVVFAVPFTTDNGDPVPGRALVVFCAYVVVLVTLVAQGLTFAPLLHKLDLRANAAEEELVRNAARLAAIDAARADVSDQLRRGEIGPDLATTLNAAMAARADRFRAREAALEDTEDGRITWTEDYESTLHARRAVIDAERREIRRWRDSGSLSDASWRMLRGELDHEERTVLSQ